MKRSLGILALVLACGPAEQPAMDTAAMAAPAGLSAADMAGTWSGVIMAEASDSIVGRFTAISPTGSDSKTIVEGRPDTIATMHTIDGDSIVATSAPYTDETLPGKPQVTFRGVARMIDGKLVGISTIRLASNPDSVVGRVRYEMTKSP
jgi:hypothetical protein